MNSEDNYISINQETWNNKTTFHVGSDFYEMEKFKNGKSSLNEIELSLLGDVKNLKILHLQCHFGQDTLSLARMGAEVTGVDFSYKAIAVAKSLAEELQLNARFICCDVYDTLNHLDEEFDVIYTSYGVLGWLPDMKKWAKIVSKLLKPGGKIVLIEFHPMVWMFDNDVKNIVYSYFNVESIVEEETGTYADKNADLTTKTVTWNHPISEVLQAMLVNGLTINSFEEFDYSPYNCLGEMEEFKPKKFRIKQFENKIPLVYTVVATRKG